MSNPLALLPLAIAAGGGRIGVAGHEDLFEARQLVAAGLTLLQRSAPLVRALSGKRSAILLPTSPHFLVALAASEGRGAVLVNPLAAPREIAFQVEDADVGAVFTTSAFASRLPGGITRVLLDDAPRVARVIAADRTQEVDLGAHHGLALEGERDAPGSDEEAVIVYTSAMDGVPRGAILTHGNLLSNARSTIDALGIDAGTRTLAPLPFSHLFGLTVTMIAPLMAGGDVHTMERFNPGLAADLLSSGVTHFAGVPSIYQSVLAALARRDATLRGSALRLCIAGGAVVPVALQDRWAEETGCEMRQGYGLTEASPVCLFNRLDEPNVRGSLGTAMPGVDVAVHGGEICVRGPNVSPGYVRGARGLARNGEWLSTGDAGVRDPSGHFRFLGLIKPMFTRNGFNIYPRELELAVCELAGVLEAHVAPIPHPGRENDIRLRVVGSVVESDVASWCLERLAAYKQPSVIEIEQPPQRAARAGT